MTEDDIRARLTQEVERLLGENARLQEEKRRDVGIWLNAERDYQGTIKMFREENAKLKDRVKELEREVEEYDFLNHEGGEESVAALQTRVKALDEGLRVIGYSKLSLSAAADDENRRHARALLTPTPEKGGE